MRQARTITGMTTMPEEGAQTSEQGQWWWDDSIQQWKLVEESGGQHPAQASSQSSGHDDAQHPHVDWSQCPHLYQLLVAQTVDDWLQNIGLNPQVLHGEHGGDAQQQLTQELDALRQATGGQDPTHANVTQIVQQLTTGSSGSPFVEILKQLTQKLQEGGDSSADQFDQLTQSLEQEVQQLQYAAGAAY